MDSGKGTQPGGTAWGYIRTATDEQGPSASAEQQQRQISTLGKSMGLQVTALTIDEGVAGTQPQSQRSGLSELTKAIDEGRCATVVVTDPSRLSTDPTVAARIQQDLQRRGAQVVFANPTAASA